ncbi:hypothetical protein M3Y94_00428600 [Aphelenchoides besseyi]|nr:hypothetical protein M3Y94_00428600 [Aphelenchoides besseyi]KAI6229503.1 hypothetical protein M3Y95_00537800 [Aphelenchoides besseyi]
MAPKSNKQVEEAGNFDAGFLQSGLMLYHRRESNRHLQVQISEGKQVDKPTAMNETSNVEIPCEIVGLDAKKTKKPIKIRFHPSVLNVAKRNEGVAKSVYKTVNKLIDDFLGAEWTMQQPQIDEVPIAEVDAFRKSMLAEHIHLHFDANSTDIRWHINSPPSFLLPIGGAKSKNKKRSGKKTQQTPITAPVAQFELHVHPPTQLPRNGHDSALKELNFESHETTVNDLDFSQRQRVDLKLVVGTTAVHSLFAIDFHSYYPLAMADGGKENDHFARFHPENGQLQICLKHSGKRADSFYGQSAVTISGCQKKMIDCAQIRLETLRHHVKQNHLRQQHRNSNVSQTSTRSSRPPVQLPENIDDCGPVAAAFHPNQRVALFQLTNTTRPVQMSRFTVIPVTTTPSDVPLRSSHPISTTDRPLHVRISDDKHKMSASAAYAEITGSPADSIDSAVVMDDEDDTLSPLPSTPTAVNANRFHFNATAHRAPEIQPHFRARSSSESWDCRDNAPIDYKTKNTVPTKIQLITMNAVTYASTLSMTSTNGSTTSLSPNGTPLRSILKKAKCPPQPGLGNTTVRALSGSVGMHRVPTRYILARSVSECQDDAGMLLDASVMAGSFSLLDDEVVSMEDLSSVVPTVNGTPLSVCAEVDEAAENSDEPEPPTEEQQRKKRVSFNEQVQARIYRSSSSILANKNKQDRRARNRENRERRRAESESMDGVEDVGPVTSPYYVPTIPLVKTSAEEKSQSSDEYLDENDEFDTQRPSNDAAQLHDRRDSGIEAADSMVTEGESSTVHDSPKRVQRVVSADSAYGDDTEMV